MMNRSESPDGDGTMEEGHSMMPSASSLAVATSIPGPGTIAAVQRKLHLEQLALEQMEGMDTPGASGSGSTISRDRTPSPPRALFRSTTGKGVAFTDEDITFLIKFMRHRK